MGENDTTIVRTNFDLVTEVLSTKIAPEVIEYARKRLYAVYDLYKEKANKTELLGNFITKVPVVVWGFSHGSEDALIGPEIGENVFDLANAVWFNNKIVSIVACHTGRKLAPAMVDAGARAVFAYSDELRLRITGDTYEPLEGFKECISAPKYIYDGLKAKDVYDAVIAEYNKWIDYWDEKDPVTADVLRHDRDCFVLVGSGESKITLSTYLFMGLTDIFAITWVVARTLLEIVRLTKPLWRGEKGG